ncbi:Amidase family protein isoform 1 [Gossypium australe]|uniref:Amidase family protein isoform 1 n=1 Tax=Gossypium australe TaxID=47621 RepID=A0A5B6V8X5_9ROSI|nr:Amidase family protein isoform 1 [Gossypium australe]
MASTKSSPLTIPLFLTWMILFLQPMVSSGNHTFSNKEATLQDLQLALEKNQLTSRQLLTRMLCIKLADEADRERKAKEPGSLSGLHGLPILLKDNFATKDKMNTTAGSLALLGSIVPRDAGVVSKLRKAGAIFLGKVSVRTEVCPVAGVLGLVKESSGSAIAAAANLAAVTLGTETDGSILCPSNNNAIVGIKPTVGLTSRAGVVPVTPRQDTDGPMCRTVADAVYVLYAIAGLDYNDKATIEASKYIPRGGYKQFLKIDGLKGKRRRRRGAVLVENVNASKYLEAYSTSIDYETLAMTAVFKLAIKFLPKTTSGKKKHKEYVQQFFLDTEAAKGIGQKEKEAILNLAKMSRDGFEKLMGQYPGIILPAGYDREGLPFGLCFGGLKGSETTLIEIAYAFEQATKIRRPPSFKH